MVGTRERHTQVTTRRARLSNLRGRRRRGPTALRAPWHTARFTPNPTNDAALEWQHRAAAQRDHQTAAIDKPLNLRETRVANATGDVVRLSRRTETWCRSRLLERHWPPRFRD